VAALLTAMGPECSAPDRLGCLLTRCPGKLLPAPPLPPVQVSSADRCAAAESAAEPVSAKRWNGCGGGQAKDLDKLLDPESFPPLSALGQPETDLGRMTVDVDEEPGSGIRRWGIKHLALVADNSRPAPAEPPKLSYPRRGVCQNCGGAESVRTVGMRRPEQPSFKWVRLRVGCAGRGLADDRFRMVTAVQRPAVWRGAAPDVPAVVPAVKVMVGQRAYACTTAPARP